MSAPGSRRTAIVTTSFPAWPGDPSGHFVETEARELVASGGAVTVLAPRPAGSRREPPAASRDFRVKWLPGGSAFGWPGALERLREDPMRAFSALVFCVATRRALAKLGPLDDVVAHWILPGAFPIALPAGPRLEVVVHGSDVGVLEKLPGSAARAIVRALFDAGARLRFVSDDLRSRVARLDARALGPRGRVQPSPVYVRGTPDRRTARTRLAVKDHERLAVVVGRLVASKRADVAISWAMARAERVIVIGDGPEHESLVAGVRQGAPRVTFLGRLPRPETLAWIAAADVLVSASRSEGAPTAVREARLLGVPVVTAPCGSTAAWAAADPGITILDA